MTTITDLPEDCLQLLEECLGLSDVVNLSEICRALAARIRNAAWPHRQVQVLHLVEIHSGRALTCGGRIKLSQISHAMRARRQVEDGKWKSRYRKAWREFIAENDEYRSRALEYYYQYQTAAGRVDGEGVWWEEPWQPVSLRLPVYLPWGPAPSFEFILVPWYMVPVPHYCEKFEASCLSRAIMACLK
jgi:hypothetical protein